MSSFTEAVRKNTGDLEAFSVGACPGCSTCGLAEDSDEHDRAAAEEPCFSWAPCDSCGSTFGGNRHPAHCLWGGEVDHLDVCEDCLHYHANGDEPEEWRRDP